MTPSKLVIYKSTRDFTEIDEPAGREATGDGPTDMDQLAITVDPSDPLEGATKRLGKV